MCEDMIIKHGSPTLVGMKTGSLFMCTFTSDHEMRNCIRSWNRVIVNKGLRALPLRHKNNKVLVYVYRTSHLLRDFQNKDTKKLLLEKGYCCDHPQICVIQLIQKIKQNTDFPHEIGLFLGYPPEDVNGFIKNKASGFKCVGCWKVYGDEKVAKNLFIKYKKCTEAYCNQYAKGVPIERLTIAG